MTRSVQNELQKLSARKAQIERRMAQLSAKQRRQKQKADTRRHLIAGKLAMKHAEADTRFGRFFRKLLDADVEKPADRELFGLSPEPGGQTDAPEPVRNPELDGCKPS